MISVNASAFATWLAGAKVGDELVYHVGDLSADSDPAKSNSRVLALNALLDEVLRARKAGRITLRQEPLPARGACQHICRRIS